MLARERGAEGNKEERGGWRVEAGWMGEARGGRALGEGDGIQG
jgi:hypothetical protein